MHETSTANWRPHRFVQGAQVLDLDAFASKYGVEDFLLIHHDDHPGVLAELEKCESSGVESEHVTPLVSMPVTHVTMVDDAFDERAQGGMRSSEQIARRLSTWQVFVLPLAKRLDNGFPAKISVGRTANNDVPLRHPTVSQFHAWFYRDDDGRLFVRDAGSKNGTLHNGAPLLGPTRVVSGDVIRFGRIEVMHCSAEVVWTLVHGDPAPYLEAKTR